MYITVTFSLSATGTWEAKPAMLESGASVLGGGNLSESSDSYS